MQKERALIKKLVDSNNNQRYYIYIGSVVVSVIFIVLIYAFGIEETTVGKIGLEAMLAIFSAVFILAFIDFFKDEAVDEARKDELKNLIEETINKENGFINKIEEAQANHKVAIEQSFVDCLTQEEVLVSKLNDSSVDVFMKDCISHYCKDLSVHYKNYIKESIDVFRKDFNYDVTVNDAKSFIKQTIKYERFFKNKDDRTKFQLKCLFLFATNDLDREMHNDSYFFCEELTNIDLVKEIKATLADVSLTEEQKKTNLIKNILHLNIALEDRVKKAPRKSFDSSNIQYKVVRDVDNTCDCGLLFYVEIPDEYIKIKDSYVNYKGIVNCQYKSDINNIFYCIFSNPTTGTTNFNMRFVNFPSDFNVRRDVKHMTILSLKGGDFTLENEGDDTISFEAREKTIFPRSGIVIHWK